MPQQNGPEIKNITISFQDGSEGARIAARLAFRLNWLLADQEITAQVADEVELAEEEAAVYDDQTFGLLDRFFLSMRYSAPEATEAWAATPFTVPVSFHAQERYYRDTLQRVVKRIAHAGECVIVGHAAQIILAGQPDVLHIRVVAPLGWRIKRIMQREQIDERSAYRWIRCSDRKQSYHLRSQYRRNINDPLLYDLVINGQGLDVDSQVDLIYQTFEHRIQQCSRHESESPSSVRFNWSEIESLMRDFS